jgi:hypothetical protein
VIEVFQFSRFLSRSLKESHLLVEGKAAGFCFDDSFGHFEGVLCGFWLFTPELVAVVDWVFLFEGAVVALDGDEGVAWG